MTKIENIEIDCVNNQLDLGRNHLTLSVTEAVMITDDSEETFQLRLSFKLPQPTDIREVLNLLHQRVHEHTSGAEITFYDDVTVEESAVVLTFAR